MRCRNLCRGRGPQDLGQVLLERCESGRIGLPAKELYSNRVPRVRIPPSPFFEAIAQMDRALDCGSKGRRFESSWLRKVCVSPGEMRERLNRADSKSVVPFYGTEGSNPSLSDSTQVMRSCCSRRDDREAEGVRLESVCTLTGYRGFESLSLRFPFSVDSQVLCYCSSPNPVRTGR